MRKTRIYGYDAADVLREWEGCLGLGWGKAGGWMPLHTGFGLKELSQFFFNGHLPPKTTQKQLEKVIVVSNVSKNWQGDKFSADAIKSDYKRGSQYWKKTAFWPPKHLQNSLDRLLRP